MSRDLTALLHTALSDLHAAEGHDAENGAALARARAKLVQIETGLTEERLTWRQIAGELVLKFPVERHVGRALSTCGGSRTIPIIPDPVFSHRPDHPE